MFLSQNPKHYSVNLNSRLMDVWKKLLYHCKANTWNTVPVSDCTPKQNTQIKTHPRAAFTGTEMVKVHYQHKLLDNAISFILQPQVQSSTNESVSALMPRSRLHKILDLFMYIWFFYFPFSVQLNHAYLKSGHMIRRS